MPSNYSIDQSAIVRRLSNDRVIQLTDDSGSGAIDSNAIDEAITAAENEFHLYASVYYNTPVRRIDGTTPAGIREKLLEATAWRLMNRRPEFLRGTTDEGQLWTNRRKETLDWYTAIASPDPLKRLLIADGVERTAMVTRDGGARVASDCSVFTRDTMSAFGGYSSDVTGGPDISGDL